DSTHPQLHTMSLHDALPISDFTLVDHPVLQRALMQLRRRETPQRAFREELQRASVLLAVEATRGLRTARVRINTPLEPSESQDVDRKSTRLNSSHVKTSYAV